MTLFDEPASWNRLEPMYLNSFGVWKTVTPELILRYSFYGMLGYNDKLHTNAQWSKAKPAEQLAA